MRVPLDESISGEIGADGTCQILAGPTSLAHTWEVAWVTVASDSAASTVAFLASATGGRLGGTRSGNQDSTDLPGVVLTTGQRLIGEWHLGTPGARCTLSVFGSIDIKGR